MAETFTRFTIDDQGIGVITFDRPPVNAMTAESYAEVGRVFRDLAKRDELRVVMLTSASDRAWIAGRDINEFLAMTVEIAEQRAPLVRECFWAVLELPVPTIAVVNGAALGAGLLMASMSDIIIASSNAVFGLPEINVGSLGGAKHLSRLVPQHKVRKMMLTGERVTAAEFHRLGVVDQVVEPDKLMDAARAVAEDIASKSPVAIRLAKEVLNRIEPMDLLPGYTVEQQYTAKLMGYADAKEAANAFLERRKPVFTGR